MLLKKVNKSAANIWVIFQHKSGMMNKIDHGTAGTTSGAKSILILEQSHWQGWPQPLLDKNLLCQSEQYDTVFLPRRTHSHRTCSVVGLSVCLPLLFVDHTKTAEPIEMPTCGVRGTTGRVHISPRGIEHFWFWGGHTDTWPRMPIVRYTQWLTRWCSLSPSMLWTLVGISYCPMANHGILRW